MTVALIYLFLIPDAKRYKSQTSKFNILGVSKLTMADILFILTVTSDSTQGWATAYVLTPLIISLVLTELFFVWKARITLEDAVLPPMMRAISQLWYHRSPRIDPLLLVGHQFPQFHHLVGFYLSTARPLLILLSISFLWALVPGLSQI
ncbi:hypothetical protein FRC14_005136 [Serendipita sp. 396]|nr:hypothetical protein FRC14_005136 [Serendipita sp. 396]KAG8789569.1 hypothetical protein FRC15_006301 [Serendipita sp. 397]KAG8802827.1 hypothetical protein FRC16_008548 [Serendipita sp. 398]KAG8872601.1 hypothetical protein FRC20_009261 [Serendipita sp. 405]